MPRSQKEKATMWQQDLKWPLFKKKRERKRSELTGGTQALPPPHRALSSVIHQTGANNTSPTSRGCRNYRIIG